MEILCPQAGKHHRPTCLSKALQVVINTIYGLRLNGRANGLLLCVYFSAWFHAGMVSQAIAQVPALVNYQGKIAVGGSSFNGMGQFKLALVNGDASSIYWMNAADGNSDGEPDQSISVTVSGGLYSILLGDTSINNMAALPPSVFSHDEVYLRVWFNDGTTGFESLSPDQRIVSVGYAMMAGNVQDGAITSAKLHTDLSSSIDSISNLSTQINQLSARLDGLETAGGSTAGMTVVSTVANDADLIQAGYQSFYTVPSANWVNGSNTGAPGSRAWHTCVWSGSEAIVWGGYLGSNIYANSGGRYDPSLNAWTTVTTFGAPVARQSHSAIWSGSEMIVWGGFGSSGYFNSGGRYNPTSQSWATVSTTGAPTVRSDHACVWTGSKMIVWGGRSFAGYLADGGVYNPAVNEWSSLTLSGAPTARHSAAAVYGNNTMIVWGGETSSGVTQSGGRLSVDGNGVPQQWQGVSTVNAPSARTGHTAVWTGSKMIVWGGRNGGTFFGDGALYDPSTDTWTPLPSTGSPTARSGHGALWSGTEMLIFIGEDGSGALSSGAAYDPSSNTWRLLSTGGGPIARSDAEAVWAGNELIVFGGSASGKLSGDVQTLDPRPTWYFYRKL
jgi:N-acetylneuraminic acid mutarotase